MDASPEPHGSATLAAHRYMRAAIIEAPGSVRLVTVARPQPGPGQVRVKIEGCGVCASNLGPWGGPDWMTFPTPPGDLGHEAWGRIDAVGAGVDPSLLGGRVAALSYKAYAEYDLADAAAVIPLPPALDAVDFPGEPLGCAMNIFDRAGIAPGQTVAIVGIGFLGALLTRLATQAGARVIALSRRPFARDLARRMGAAETLAIDDPPAAIAAVREMTGGAFCPRVIEAVGRQDALDLAAELTAERGRLIVAGYHQDGPRQVNMWLWNWRGLDVVNAHERAPHIYVAGMRAAVAAVAAGRIDPAPLLTHDFPLERLGAALDATRDRPDGFVKAVIRP